MQMKRLRWFFFLFLAGVQCIVAMPAGGAEPARAAAATQPKDLRVAVVIGNGRYPSGTLANPPNDATAMATALKNLGFDVELKLDASKADMDAIFKRLSAKAEQAGVAALFYAGHGIQVNGSNYIVPIDANPKSERDLKREMVKMDDVIDDMDGAKVKLVFFDACRDNPLSRSFNRGASRGMAAPVEATGTLISFATKHGNTAADGEGEHSPYTTALLAALEDARGVEIEQMLRKVQQGVRQATKGQQEPWRYGSLDGDFYFQAPAPQADAGKLQQEAVDRAIQEAVKRASEQAAAEAARRAAEQQVRERATSAANVELSYWDSIKAGQNADDFRAYVKRYPAGSFVDLAQNRIAALEREAKRQGEEARTAAKQPAAPAGGDQTAVELTFWDSIKTSGNVDDLKEYLANYPQGRFAGLARNRIRTLESAPGPAAAKPAVAPAAPQAAQATVQIAMIAPSKPAPAPATDSALPQAGDSWTYRYVNAWRKDSPQTVVVKVEESDTGRVIDRMSLHGGRVANERSFEGKPEAADRALGRDVRVLELLPYAQILLKEDLKAGQEKTFPDLVLGIETYRVKAKIVGQEQVSVPAGNFAAWRVEILGERLGSALIPAQGGVVASITHTIWFVPEIKRVVKVTHKGGNPWRAVLDNDSLELISYTPSGQAPAQPTAPPAGTAALQSAAVDVGSALPRVGDSWTYRYINGWRKGSPETVLVKVEESEAGRVIDRMSLRGERLADERSFDGKPEAVERALGHDVRILELLPYAQTLLQEGMKPGQEKSLADLALGTETYRVKVKFVGQEKISVPAGSFDALRVEIAGQRLGALAPGQVSTVNLFTHVVWFAPEIRRVVKATHKSGNPWRTFIDDDSLELVSHSLR